MKDKLKFLKLIVHSKNPPECGITGLCGGYELKEWRYSQFTDWLFDEHLLDFALKYSEFKMVDGKTAPKKLREAAKIIFQTDIIKRGEFGESYIQVLNVSNQKVFKINTLIFAFVLYICPDYLK